MSKISTRVFLDVSPLFLSGLSSGLCNNSRAFFVGAQRQALEAAVDFALGINRRQDRRDRIVGAVELDSFGDIALDDFARAINVDQGRAVLVGDPEISGIGAHESLGIEAVDIERQNFLRSIIVGCLVDIFEV